MALPVEFTPREMDNATSANIIRERSIPIEIGVDGDGVETSDSKSLEENGTPEALRRRTTTGSLLNQAKSMRQLVTGRNRFKGELETEQDAADESRKEHSDEGYSCASRASTAIDTVIPG